MKAIVVAPPPAPVAGKGLSLLAPGASLFSIVVADMVLKRAFLRAGLTFPASLAGMAGLFAGKDWRIKDSAVGVMREGRGTCSQIDISRHILLQYRVSSVLSRSNCVLMVTEAETAVL